MKQLFGISLFACLGIVFTVMVVSLAGSPTGDFVHSGTYLQYTPDEACSLIGPECIFSMDLTSTAVAAPYNTPMVACVCRDGVYYTALTVPVVGLAK